MSTKVLALSAAYNDAETLPHFLNCLSQLDPKPHRHVFATNNCTDDTNAIIDAAGHERISWDAHPDFIMRMGDPYVACAVPWQRLLRRARELFAEDPTYTHALYLDTDVFVLTPNAVAVAAGYGKAILCGSYLRDFPDGRFLATTFQVNDDLVAVLPEFAPRRGEFLHLNSRIPGIMHPFASSAGFMLLTREIVLDRRVNFFPIYKVGWLGKTYRETSPEFGYQLQAREHGYETWLDGEIVLSHYVLPRHRAWRSNGGDGYADFRYVGVKE